MRIGIVIATTCRGTYVGVLAGEDDDLIELREVGDEVVYSWSFCGPPAVFALYVPIRVISLASARIRQEGQRRGKGEGN